MNSLQHTPQEPLFKEERSQTTSDILMIEPVAFGFNSQTALNNYFQQPADVPAYEIQQKALDEFRNMVGLLRSKGVNVFVVKDTLQPHSPDSIFPNNWVSFHQGGQVVLYPMFAENRRIERRKDILEYLTTRGVKMNNVDDFTFWEEQGLFLEGTGSMIFDRINNIAYAALSERTSKSLFLQFCFTFGLKPVCFSAFQSVRGKRLLVYHTNVLMTVANRYAVICLNAIDSKNERKLVADSLVKTGKEIIQLTEHQMHCFAGNMLQVENQTGLNYLILSQSAYDSLDPFQTDRLSSFNELVVVPIPTIERVGGGSVRCMMAEIF